MTDRTGSSNQKLQSIIKGLREAGESDTSSRGRVYWLAADELEQMSDALGRIIHHAPGSWQADIARKAIGDVDPKGELLSESALEMIKERAHSVWVRYQVCSKHLTQDEQEIAQLLRHIDALQPLRAALRLVLPLAKGYAPAGQSDSARKTCREWVQAAEDALEGGSDETSEQQLIQCPCGCGCSIPWPSSQKAHEQPK